MGSKAAIAGATALGIEHALPRRTVLSRLVIRSWWLTAAGPTLITLLPPNDNGRLSRTCSARQSPRWKRTTRQSPSGRQPERTSKSRERTGRAEDLVSRYDAAPESPRVEAARSGPRLPKIRIWRRTKVVQELRALLREYCPTFLHGNTATTQVTAEARGVPRASAPTLSSQSRWARLVAVIGSPLRSGGIAVTRGLWTSGLGDSFTNVRATHAATGRFSGQTSPRRCCGSRFVNGHAR